MFSLPGQGTASNPNFLGKLLAGTPLGIDPLKAATDANTIATGENTVALRAAAFGGRAGGGVMGAAGSVLQAGGWRTAAGTPLAASTVGGPIGLYDPANPVMGPASSTGVPMYDPATGTFTGPVAAAHSNLGLYKGIGVAGMALAGAFGAYSGFRAGGAQGILTGSGSLMGAAGGITALLAPTSALGPIGLIAGMGLGLAASWLGDPKKRRQERMAEDARSRAFDEPVGGTYATDIYGRSLDYNYRGGVRQIIVNNYNQQTVQAWDAGSLRDFARRNAATFSDAVTAAVAGGNGDELVGTLRQTMAL
jgi:hypothetical protein